MTTRIRATPYRAGNDDAEASDPLALLRENAEAREAQEERSWLLPYIDVVTLLLTVMVVMLAYQPWDPMQPVDATAGQTKRSAAANFPDLPQQTSATQPDGALIGMEFRALIERERLGDLVDLQVEQSRIKLQIRDSILFGLGEAQLTTPGLLILDKIIPVLNNNDLRISIEGHTDPLPIRTQRFPSNWELSSARASTVLRFLVERGLDKSRLRAVGYADTLPLQSNGSEEGRAANRRVSLVVYTGEMNWNQ